MESCYFHLGLVLLLSLGVNARNTGTGMTSTVGNDSFGLQYLRENTIELLSDDWLETLSSEIITNCPDKRKDVEGLVLPGSKYETCFQKKTKSLNVELMNAIATYQKNEVENNLVAVSILACELNSGAQKCLKYVNKVASKKCAPEGVRSIAMLNHVMHFLCGDNYTAENLTLLMSPSVDQCYGMYEAEIQNCISEDKNKTEIVSGQENTCRNLTRMHTCTHKSLRKCQNSTTDDLFSSLNKIIEKSTGCDVVIDSSGSFNGSPSLVSLFLAILVYFLYNSSN